MKGLWSISPSSAPLVQRCIDAARASEENNKWTKAFQDASSKNNFSIIHPENPSNSALSMPENLSTIDTEEKCDDLIQDRNGNHKILTEVIETDLVTKWSYVVDECDRNGSLFTSIAGNVGEDCLEKFCEHIFASAKDLPNEFVRNFLNIFLPTYLKKPQSRFTLNCIDRALKCFPLHFKTVFLPCLVKDLDIPSNILSDYVQTLSASEKTDFLTKISDVKLSSEEFGHHLTALYTLYKDCEPTLCIQSYVLSNLEEHCNCYTTDKNFGKLLLTFMQNCSVKHVNMKMLEKAVLSHQSAFKTPCIRKLESDFKLLK